MAGKNSYKTTDVTRKLLGLQVIILSAENVRIYVCSRRVTTVNMVNILKFWTHHSILWPEACFLWSCFLKYFVEWQTVLTLFRLWSSLIWSYTVFMSHFVRTLVYKILGHLHFCSYHLQTFSSPISKISACKCLILEWWHFYLPYST